VPEYGGVGILRVTDLESAPSVTEVLAAPGVFTPRPGEIFTSHFVDSAMVAVRANVEVVLLRLV